MIKKLLFLLVGLLIIGTMMFSAGYWIAREAVSPEVYIQIPPPVVINNTIEVVREVIIEVEVVRLVEVQVPVIQTVTEVVYRDYIKPLKHWDNLAQLKAFLDEDNTDRHIPSYPGFDCDDYAYILQRQAAEAGYFIATEYQQTGWTAHMLNSAKVGNDLYLIEPQTDEFWFYTRLD